MDVPVAEEPIRATPTRPHIRALQLPAGLTAYWEIALVASLTGIAAVVRLWRLTTTPWGFHNDEGNVILDAQRILHEGWIGPYSLLALGYPIAVNYYIAPFIKVFGASVFGVRFPIAVLGIITVPLCYYTIRLATGWRAALCGTIIYSFSIWHVHLSRVGFPVMGWQVTELGSLLCIQLGIRTRKPWYFVIAGLLIGVGTWVYNSAFLYAVAVAVWIAAWFVLTNYRRVWRSIVAFRGERTWDVRPVRDVVLLLILLASTLLAASPLIAYARDEKNHYTNHFQSVYVFSDERRDACLAAPPGGRDVNCVNTLASGSIAKARVVRHNMVNLYHWLTDESHADGADGLGVKPPVGKIAMYLAIVGAAIALFRIGNPAMGIGLLSVPLIFISTSVTVDGQFRRSFGLLPFIALFGGLVLGLIWEWADRNIVAVRITIVAFLAMLLGTYGYQNLRFYFHTYPDTPAARFVFFPEMREASEYLDSVGHPYVYWYNERATLGHESRRVLAPNIAGGEERAALSGVAPTDVRLGLVTDPRASFPPTQPPDGAVFVFFGSYDGLLDQIAAKYPPVEGLPPPIINEVYSDQYRVYDYRAYYLPGELLDYYAQKEGASFIVRPKP